MKPLETYQVQTAKAAPGLKRLAPYDPGLSLVNAWASVLVSNTCGARSRSDRADPSFRRMKALVPLPSDYVGLASDHFLRDQVVAPPSKPSKPLCRGTSRVAGRRLVVAAL